jgi:hypothetical protein
MYLMMGAAVQYCMSETSRNGQLGASGSRSPACRAQGHSEKLGVEQRSVLAVSGDWTIIFRKGDA